MKIHEYQAKSLFRQAGIPVPPGEAASSTGEAVKIAQGLGYPVAVKAQVHVGGRGKAGGIAIAHSAEEVRSGADRILGMDIKGLTVREILVERAAEIERELYLSITVDRANRCLVLMASPAGGVDIEQVAADTPEKILKVLFTLSRGLRDFQIRQIAKFLGLSGNKQVPSLVKSLYQLFRDKDCSLAEINPLVVTKSGELLACDGKVLLDDNALYRHPDLAALRDTKHEDPLETRARERKLSYVHLTGTIGCIVNGAGLAMATMDVVKHYGADPANFLDIGGGAKEEQVSEAIRIITSDKAVNTIFFNIFGGIVRCDRVARGILQVLKEMDLGMPVVVRLNGTNSKEAREMLAETDLISLSGMSEAAQKAVEVSRQ